MKYKMLVLSTTITTIEAENDAQALKVFRKNSKSRELRAERQSGFQLGRLIAYKDAAGTEHVANMIHSVEPDKLDGERVG